MGPFRNSFQKHHRDAGHLRTCSECRTAVERERRYLERLRSAEIPAASSDFTARLLERTHELAAVSETPADRTDRKGFVARAVAVGASGTLATAGLLTAAALLLAGDPVPRAEPPTSAAAPNLAALVPGTAAAEASFPAGGSSSDSGTGSPASRLLTSAELAALRETGWACPELESLGFRMVSARAVWWQGAPAIKLHLSRGGHDAMVVEQRTGAGDTTSPVPVSFETGGPAPEDGFVATPAPTRSSAEHTDEAEAWVRPTNPVAVIYRSRNATVSYFADAEPGAEPGPDFPSLLQELATARAAADQGVYGDVAGEPGKTNNQGLNRNEPLTERLGRGFRIMLGLSGQ